MNHSRCPHCAAPVHPAMRFCPICGQPQVVILADEPAPRALPPTPRPYSWPVRIGLFVAFYAVAFLIVLGLADRWLAPVAPGAVLDVTLLVAIPLAVLFTRGLEWERTL